MKKLLLLICVMSVFAACEDIEDNSPALQAEIDDVFFKSLGSAAVINQDQTMTIQASTQDQTLTLFVERGEDGVFGLGDGSESFASFEDAFGNVYITDPVGSGSITISNLNPGSNVSGSFNFEAFSAAADTLTVQKGIFFEVPFTPGVEIPAGADPNIPDGTFVAQVDGELYNVTDVQTSINNSVLVIDGIMDNETISLIISLTATAGSYSIPGGGYFADYVVNGEIEGAVDGNVRIFSHDTSAKTMKGTFVFTTQNHQISLGQFNISY